MRRILALSLLVCLFVPAAIARAQSQKSEVQSSKLVITVADPSGGVIPGAKVTVTPKAEPAITTATGIATFDGLAPGQYTITAEFQGFETVTIKDYRVRAGDNKRTIVLPLKKVAEDVTVGRDKQSAGLDPRGNAFS